MRCVSERLIFGIEKHALTGGDGAARTANVDGQEGVQE